MISLDSYFAFVFFILGTTLGSFFNVLIYRIPIGKSVVSPPSACPHCGHKIQWYENIPILSYIFLGGKCSSCKQKISIRYPIVELLTGLYSLLLYVLFYHDQMFSASNLTLGLLPAAVQYITLMLFIPISIIDIEEMIIPNEFTIGGTVLALLVSFIPGGITPLQSFLGLIAGSGILIIFGKLGELALKKEAMGWGDIKMLAWFGALFGVKVALLTIFIGAFVGVLGSAIQILLKKLKTGEHLPFGPYLCIGAFIAIIWGDPILSWYLNLAGIN